MAVQTERPSESRIVRFSDALFRFRHAEPAAGWVLTHRFRRYLRLCRIEKNGGSRPTLRKGRGRLKEQIFQTASAILRRLICRRATGRRGGWCRCTPR
ncbi:hypothetical protein HMPREF9123_2015 [Neisseria bacilliformis ATCC BAA-1200]|uniref:Uncharacterized protein n=1 Tax=Neisseria bacilliformis ATCC BAA-1200 TaxID=888742 RepID=F2BE59_9NEIS|nr:hypothetical protein HMPREF9123_2015 [Neisseria bacilliformis ATCC BAA-1200]